MHNVVALEKCGDYDIAIGVASDFAMAEFQVAVRAYTAAYEALKAQGGKRFASDNVPPLDQSTTGVACKFIVDNFYKAYAINKDVSCAALERLPHGFLENHGLNERDIRTMCAKHLFVDAARRAPRALARNGVESLVATVKILGLIRKVPGLEKLLK